jgi:hypothetical protein
MTMAIRFRPLIWRIYVVVVVLGVGAALIGLLPGQRHLSCSGAWSFGTEGGHATCSGDRGDGTLEPALGLAFVACMMGFLLASALAIRITGRAIAIVWPIIGLVAGAVYMAIDFMRPWYWGESIRLWPATVCPVLLGAIALLIAPVTTCLAVAARPPKVPEPELPRAIARSGSAGPRSAAAGPRGV